MPALKADLNVTTTTTTTQTVTLKPALRRQLLIELKAYAGLREQLKAIEGALDMHKATIGRLRADTGETSLSLEGFKITHVTPVRSTLDKKLLLLNGVTMAQITDSTVVKPTKAFDKITVPGEIEREF